MAELNNAWAVLSNPVARAGYDQQRRLRNGGGRWDAFANSGSTSAGPSDGRILEFGRFAGWSIPQVARSDPDYLEWFERTPHGRRYQVEIDSVLGRSATASVSASALPRRRGPLHWR